MGIFSAVLAALTIFLPLSAQATIISGLPTVTVSSSPTYTTGSQLIFAGCNGTYTVTAILALVVTVSPTPTCTVTSVLMSLGVTQVNVPSLFMGEK